MSTLLPKAPLKPSLKAPNAPIFPPKALNSTEIKNNLNQKDKILKMTWATGTDL